MRLRKLYLISRNTKESKTNKAVSKKWKNATETFAK